MPKYSWEGQEIEVPPEREEEARAAGLVPADVSEAGQGTSLESIGRGAQRAVGALADIGGQVGESIEKATGFGTAPGLESDEGGRPAGGQDLMPEAYDQRAKLIKEAHPFLSGVGTALAAAPAAAAAATLAPEVAAIPFLGGSLGGLAAGSAVQGTAQEYDDAWLRDNPMKLANVVENTLLFAATDLGFMGAGKLVKGAASRIFGTGAEEGLSIGRTDMVSDAQRAARESSGATAKGPGINANAEEIAAPFHQGIDSMSNRDAAVLARDGEHYIQLAAQSSSDAFERANTALSDAGAELKGWTAVQKAVLRSVGEEDLTSPVSTMRALYSQDPRELAAFGRRLGGALDELDGLIKDRGEPGDVLKGPEQYQGKPDAAPLEDARQAIAGALQDYHVASAVGVARNQVENAAANPKSWTRLLVDVAGHAPVVGHGVRAAKGAAHLIEALRGTGHTALEEGGALSNAFDSALDRYAQSPGWQNPSVAANYPAWITEQMGKRRSITADVAPGATPPAGESIYGSQPQPSEAYQRARAIMDRRGGQSGFSELGQSGRQFDPQELRSTIDALPEAKPLTGTTEYPSAEFQAKRGSLNALEGRTLFIDYVGADYKELRAAVRGEAVSPGIASSARRLEPALEKMSIDNPTAHGPLYRGMPVTDEALSDLMHDDTLHTASITSASYNAEEARNFATPLHRGKGQNPVIFKIEHADRGALINPTEHEVVLPRGGLYHILGRERLPTGETLITVSQVGKVAAKDAEKMGAMGFVQSPSASASPGQFAAGLATSPMGVTIGLGAVGLGAGKLLQQVPQQREPEPLYRQALSEIDAAGDAHIQSVARSVVQGAPATGKRAVPTMQFAGSSGDSVERARDVLQRTGNDPGSLIDLLSASTGQLSKTHPEVYSAVVAKAAQIHGYLRQQLPERVGATMLNPQGAPLSFDTAVDFLSKYLGATRPKQTMQDIARGAASPEQADAFRQNWPDRWQRLQMEVVGIVQRRTAAGRPLPGEKLRRLDSLLGLDGQLDASASPVVAQAILQSLDAAAAKQQQPGQKPPNAAQSKTIAESFQSSHTVGDQ